MAESFSRGYYCRSRYTRQSFRGPVHFIEIELEDSDFGNGWEYIDFKNNKFVDLDASYYGKRYLTLGENK